MPDIPLLGQHTRAHEENASNEEDSMNVTTASMVYLTSDGQYMMSTDINLPIIPERQPSRDEVVAASHIVIKDLQIQETLENIPNVLLQFNMAMAQKSQNAQLQQEVMRQTRK